MTLKNIYKLERHNDKFCIAVRPGGRGAEFVGASVMVKEKSGKQKLRTVTEVVEDFGADDVVMLAVD